MAQALTVHGHQQTLRHVLSRVWDQATGTLYPTGKEIHMGELLHCRCLHGLGLPQAVLEGPLGEWKPGGAQGLAPLRCVDTVALGTGD